MSDKIELKLKRTIDDALDMIKYLLPLAKGYVATNPGIRSTETIIEDAEAMINELEEENNRLKKDLKAAHEEYARVSNEKQSKCEVHKLSNDDDFYLYCLEAFCDDVDMGKVKLSIQKPTVLGSSYEASANKLVLNIRTALKKLTTDTQSHYEGDFLSPIIKKDGTNNLFLPEAVNQEDGSILFEWAARNESGEISIISIECHDKCVCYSIMIDGEIANCGQIPKGKD